MYIEVINLFRSLQQDIAKKKKVNNIKGGKKKGSLCHNLINKRFYTAINTNPTQKNNSTETKIKIKKQSRSMSHTQDLPL